MVVMPVIRPRRWQIDALAAWKSAGRRGVVSVVTGGGKTVFAQLCITDFIASFPSGQIVIVVPTLSLMDQWYVCLREELGLEDSAIATFSGRGRPSHLRFANLMVVNTARSIAQDGPSVEPRMLVVDECHRAGSAENAKALSGEYLATLGMSATPKREHDAGFETFVVPRLGDVIFQYGMNEAGQDGILATFDLVNVEISMLQDEQQKYRSLSKRIGMLRAREHDEAGSLKLERLYRMRSRVSALSTMRIPVTVSLIEQHRGSRAMVFHEDIRAAERIRDLLFSRGHSVTIYHSRISPSVRRDNLRLYRRGVFDVLVSCRALDEGINVPETKVAVVASATASTRQRVQRLGRVLRPANGKECATIYTIYASEAEGLRLRQEAETLTAARSIRWMRASGPTEGARA